VFARRVALGVVALVWAFGGGARTATADVVVLANRAGQAVRYRLAAPDGAEAKPATAKPDAWSKVEAGDIATVPVAGAATLEFLAGQIAERYDLEADRCYFFYQDKAGRLKLEAIGLASEAAQAADGDPPRDEPRKARKPADVSEPPSAKLLSIPVKLLVDDDERAARPRWEARLRARLETASALFERCCRVKFVAAEVETWDSDNAISDFEQSLAEFERKVQPRPQRLAIGFTSQYPLVAGRVHLGGTRGPLHSHILLREWSQQISESERLEVLVHELGHFLGAVHSPEANSVMRPTLGDRQARVRKFRIAFDPLNALAMCLVGEALQSRPAPAFSALPSPARGRLIAIYRTLAEALPDDPAPPQYLALLGVRAAALPFSLGESAPQSPPANDEALPPARRSAAGNAPAPDSPRSSNRPRMPNEPRLPKLPLAGGLAGNDLNEATQSVLQAIVSQARSNRARPSGRQAAHEDLFRREGDDLTDSCVRAAAEAAEDLPQIYRQQAFCLGLAIGLDTTEQLRGLPLLGELVRTIEPAEARAARLETLGVPTMRKRHDLAQHFWVSAAIASIAGPAAAEAAGVAKELRDSGGGSGFSFCDLCADLAGISLAERLKSGQTTFSALRRQFEVARHLPPLDDLVEGLSAKEFSERFGSTSDPRFLEARQKILDRIAELRRER